MTIGAGSGYTTAPQVTITSADGKGTGATATAVINGSGALVAVNITNPGTGYDTAPLISFGGPGTGATATATVATAGSGYSLTTPPTVKIDAPTGANPITAAATAVVSRSRSPA